MPKLLTITKYYVQEILNSACAVIQAVALIFVLTLSTMDQFEDWTHGLGSATYLEMAFEESFTIISSNTEDIIIKL